jgi:hypothetical protein
MRQVPQIKAAYDWVIGVYQAEVSKAMAAGNIQTVDHLGETRDTLERGVFVLLFGQFENAVNEYFEDARNARSSNPDWTHRRGWDIPAYRDARRVPFETRLALVLDQQNPSRNKIMEAYALRNHCAHGGTREPVGSIDQFVNDLYVWQVTGAKVRAVRCAGVAR